MRKALYLLALPLLMACGDYIAEDDRYIELPNAVMNRRVLIEDFTGQSCTNCPDAHQVIRDLQTQYGEQVIAVAIHAGHFGIAEGSNPTFVGLMQPEGNTYADYWQVASYPAGVINRTSGVLKHTDWAAYSRTALMGEPTMQITVNDSLSADSIIIHTEIISQTDTDGKLQLWITESNITAPQLQAGTLVPSYQHHHVYRASVNGLWGEEVSLTNNSPCCTTHKIALRDNWDISNLSVVAFVYNESDGVLQVTEHHIETVNNNN